MEYFAIHQIKSTLMTITKKNNLIREKRPQNKNQLWNTLEILQKGKLVKKTNN